MTIRWKLFTTHLLVVLVAVGILGIYLDRELERRAIATLKMEMLTEARLVGSGAAGALRSETRGSLDDRLRTLARTTEARVTLIGRDGTVLADSEHDPRTMENHGYRAEVRQALSTGSGSSVRHSSTLNVDMLYVAAVARENSATVGVVRLAKPLREVDSILRRLRVSLAVAGLAALLVGLLLSLRLADGLSRGIRSLHEAAVQFAGGNLGARARVGEGGELRQLADTLNDMADRLDRSHRRALEQQHTTTTILEQICDAILVTNRSGRILMCNREAERLLGLSRDAIVGRSVLDATQSAALGVAVERALSEQQPTASEVRLFFPRARTLEAVVTALPIEGSSRDDDRTPGAVTVLHDVTELRRLEGVRREFVANASHELQTPITAVKALVEALLAGGTDNQETVTRFLHDIEQQVSRMGALVRDLLDLASIEARAPDMEVGELNVGEVVRGVVKQSEALARRREVAVELDIPEDLTVRADWFALNRIVTNLVDNALKYTEPGGRVTIRAARSGKYVTVCVADTGIGILSSDLPRIFERFYRVDHARSREAGGTGLGLAIVKHLAEALGGRVDVQSRLGRGSEFTVSLPAG